VQVLLIDDHPIIRLALGRLIAHRWPSAQVLEADTVAGGLRLLECITPIAVVWNLSLPATMRREGIQRIRDGASGVPMLVLGGTRDECSDADLQCRGLTAVVLDDTGTHQVLAALSSIIDNCGPEEA